MITQERLRSVLAYDGASGVFVWLERRGQYPAGTRAGSLNGHGHRMVAVDGRVYMAHRLAWLYVHGSWPCGQIDHINGQRDDNRIANLREATESQNAQNRRGPSTRNAIGVLGVYVDKTRTKRPFRACIAVNGKRQHLGYFESQAEAEAAYVARKRQVHSHCTI